MTRDIIRYICREIKAYIQEKGYLPKTEQEVAREIILVNPFFLGPIPIPRDEINDGIYCFDPWGNPIRYKYFEGNEEKAESFIIYSYGPNGVDENGAGDDICEINTYKRRVK